MIIRPLLEVPSIDSILHGGVKPVFWRTNTRKWWHLRAVYNVRVRVHTALLRVGEADKGAQHQEPVQEGDGETPGGNPDMVPGHHIPLLRPHQLHRRVPTRQLHRLHHSRPGPHGHFCSCSC